MNIAEPKVKLITMSKNPIQTIYLSARQCYKMGWVGDCEILEDGTIKDNSADELISVDSQKKLIENVLGWGHRSVIEHVSFTFAVDGVSRAESHQHVRHRIASYSQQSQRFCDTGEFNVIVPPSIKEDEESYGEYMSLMENIKDNYLTLQSMLRQKFGEKDKRANEDARFVLPNACETKFNFTMNCSSLLHFFSERCCTKAQWEIRYIANECLKVCKQELPIVFKDAGPKCFRTGMCFEPNSCGIRPSRDEVMEIYNKYKNVK